MDLKPWGYLNFNKMSASGICELLGHKVKNWRVLQAIIAAFITRL